MHQKRRLRATFVALAGVIATFAVPAAAQANHITDAKSSASCTLVDNVPTVSYSIAFESFGSGNTPITGTIKLDNVVVKSYTGATAINWSSFTNGAYTLTDTVPATAGSHAFVAEFTWPGKGANDNYKVTRTVQCPTPPPSPAPAIDLVKTGAAFGYAGDTVEYRFAVKNTGNVELALGTISDGKCIAAPVRKPGETDTSFGPGDTFNYTCAYTIPALAAGGTTVTNTASVCGTYMQTQKCDVDTHEFPVRSIAIDVTKTAVESTAVAGTPVHFTITVTNTGTTAYVGYVFDDAACDEVRAGANAADTTLDPGETWSYTCEMATAVGQTTADNAATATGTNSDGKSATDSSTASIPLTQPVPPTDTPPTDTPPTDTPPTTTPPTVTPTTPPGGGVLPEEIVSGRARLSGPSGCVKQAFTARVRGRSIATVAFYVDGRLVKTLKGTRASYALKVKPSTYGFGRHRVEARVTFTASSGTAVRRLPLTFRRCAQGAVDPRFTG